MAASMHMCPYLFFNEKHLTKLITNITVTKTNTEISSIE
jgi:hypothetical protein